MNNDTIHNFSFWLGAGSIQIGYTGLKSFYNFMPFTKNDVKRNFYVINGSLNVTFMDLFITIFRL